MRNSNVGGISYNPSAPPSAPATRQREPEILQGSLCPDQQLCPRTHRVRACDGDPSLSWVASARPPWPALPSSFSDSHAFLFFFSGFSKPWSLSI